MRLAISRKSLMLLVALLVTPESMAGDDLLLDIPDAEYRTACGPVCCYISLRSLGCQATLAGLAKECGWKEGLLTPFPKLYDVLARRRDVTCRATKLSPQSLRGYLNPGKSVAILPVRKYSGEINHAVTAVDADKEGIIVIEYPEMRHRIPYERLAEIWDGETLIVSLSSPGWLGLNWPYAILPVSCLMALLAHLARRWSAARRDRPGLTSLLTDNRSAMSGSRAERAGQGRSLNANIQFFLYWL